MKVGKPKSKRVPVRLRHKIEKASAAKQRKQRKEAKKNPQWKSRVKKDPGIPNLFPYKAKLLAEVEEAKRRKVEEGERRREVAKARRDGRAVEGEGERIRVAVNEKDDVDEHSHKGGEDVEEMDVEDEDEEAGANPMAALLASAKARADAYAPEDDEEDDSEDDADENEDWTNITSKNNTARKSADPSLDAKAKGLPRQALADPIKTCTALLAQLQQTTDGIQKLIEHYNIPPLVTAGSDLPTRFLVDVARKRGRLGRGGVPNLHSAALTVLSDVHEGRVVLPAVRSVRVAQKKVTSKGDGKERGEVTVVERMAEPFRIEGLFGDDDNATEEGGVGVVQEAEMVVER